MPLLVNPKKLQSGLVISSPTAQALEPIEMVKNFSVDYAPVYVDLRWMPEDALLTHLEGAQWTVTYFSQVITKDSDLSGQQTTADGVYQQFIQINAMNLRVTSALEASQESDGKSMQVTGTAMTLPFIIPNEGDMFITEISPGEKALFRITNTTKKSIFNQACYEISYGLDTTDPVKLTGVYSKVVKNLYYHANYLTYGKNPLLVATEAQALTCIASEFATLLDFYLKKFISIEYKTLIIPDQVSVIHDPWLTQFMMDSFSTTNNYRMLSIKQINMQGDAYLNTPTVWRAIGERNKSWLRMGFPKFTLVSRMQFEMIPALAGWRYAGMAYLVYPNQGVYNVDVTINNTLKLGSEVWLERSQPSKTPAYWVQDGEPNSMGESPVIDEDTGLPIDNQEDYPIKPVQDWFDFPRGDQLAGAQNLNLFYTTQKYQKAILPVSDKDWYVFSAEFYQNKPYNAFEQMVSDYIEKKPIDKAQLSDLSKLCLYWGNVEQFYYIPVVLAMMKTALMGG